jgi:hypothetical protein
MIHGENAMRITQYPVAFELFQPSDIDDFVQRNLPMGNSPVRVEYYGNEMLGSDFQQLLDDYDWANDSTNLILGITIIGINYPCTYLRPTVHRYDNLTTDRQIDFYFAHRSGNSFFHVRVMGHEGQTFGLYLKSAIRGSTGYNSAPVGQIRSIEYILKICTKGIGIGKKQPHYDLFRWPIYCARRPIAESHLIYMWLEHTIVVKNDVPVFSRLPIDFTTAETPVKNFGNMDIVIIDNYTDADSHLTLDTSDADYSGILKEKRNTVYKLMIRIRNMFTIDTIMGETLAGSDPKISDRTSSHLQVSAVPLH